MNSGDQILDGHGEVNEIAVVDGRKSLYLADQVADDNVRATISHLQRAHDGRYVCWEGEERVNEVPCLAFQTSL